MKLNKYLVTSLALLALTTACNKKQAISDVDDDSAILTAESAISGVTSAMNDSEQSNSYVSNKPKTSIFDMLIPKAYAGVCSLGRFSPAIGTASCSGTLDDKTVTSDFNNCNAGAYGEFILDGKVTLSFDTAITCDSWINGGFLPTSGYVIRTTDGFVRHNPNGSFVSTDSNPAKNYLGASIGGGIKTSFNADGRSFDILGLHRTRTRPNGRPGFDHTVRTNASIVVSGSRLGNDRMISSGEVLVDHNYLRYTSAVSFTNLKWANTCCHPVSGSVKVAQSGSLKNSFNFDYSTGQCGLVKITDQNGDSKELELWSCE